MELVQADGQVLERIMDETHAIWADGLSRHAYGRYNAGQLRTPWGAGHLRRFALLDERGEVLSSAKRYEFDAHLDGNIVRIVGFGAVFTPAAHRGRGYARTLLERLMTRAADEGAALALLFSEIDPDYYARMGFVPIPRRELTIRPREKAGAPAVLVRAGEDRDVPAVTAIAQSMASRHRFALVPSADLIRYSLSKKRLLAGLLPPELLTVEFFIVEEGASAVAFAIITTTPEDAVLEMCGDRDPSGARVGALLQVLRARHPGEPAQVMSCFLPPRWLPPQVDVESSAPVREVMMVRPLKEGVLQKRLKDEDVLYWRGDLF